MSNAFVISFSVAFKDYFFVNSCYIGNFEKFKIDTALFQDIED
jgi:hypothetical protein